ALAQRDHRDERWVRHRCTGTPWASVDPTQAACTAPGLAQSARQSPGLYTHLPGHAGGAAAPGSAGTRRRPERDQDGVAQSHRSIAIGAKMGCLLKANGLYSRTTIGAVLLAAGAGARLGGRPKALLELGGVPLIMRQLIALSGAGIDELVVVLGHHADAIE